MREFVKWDYELKLPEQAADLIDRSDDLGTLEPGKIADLIAVDADPLADITSLENVSVVIKEGRRVK